MKTAYLLIALSILLFAGTGILRSIQRQSSPFGAVPFRESVRPERQNLRIAIPVLPGLRVFTPPPSILRQFQHPPVQRAASGAQPTAEPSKGRVRNGSSDVGASGAAPEMPAVPFSAATEIPAGAAMAFDVRPGARLPMALLGFNADLPTPVRQAGEQIAAEFGQNLMKGNAPPSTENPQVTIHSKASENAGSKSVLPADPVSRADEQFHALYGDEAYNEAGIVACLDAMTSLDGATSPRQ